mmetsp:Transcript_21400/g.43768  ORF Transcript_21400/g.43768 Transcript_21400/m.43768 type:complete len:157 (-) Transcript_21400:262-732(-)
MRAQGSLGAGVPVLGIVKAPLANEEEEAASQKNGWPPSTTGVAPFRRDYFNCRQSALYVDEALEAYKLLGDRTLQMPWRKMLTRPWAAWRDLQAINMRMREKGVVAQSGGEGAVLGGICVIGPQDRTSPSYVYREEIGQPIPAGEIEEAIRQVLGA